MKKSFIVSAILITVYYLVRQLLGREEEEISEAPRKKHLTNAFSKAKQHAVTATENAAI